MKKNYLKPLTKISFNQLQTYMQMISDRYTDDEEEDLNDWTWDSKERKVGDNII